MLAKLGNYVTTSRHNHQGRIYSKHHDFDGTGETKEWFNMQEPPIPIEDINKAWYSILCKNGGAIHVPESDIIRINEPYKLNNIWESFYF